jgi:hypothetical protein
MMGGGISSPRPRFDGSARVGTADLMLASSRRPSRVCSNLHPRCARAKRNFRQYANQEASRNRKCAPGPRKNLTTTEAIEQIHQNSGFPPAKRELGQNNKFDAEMNWKPKALAPAFKALSLTLIVFTVLICVCAAVAAHSIWIQGHHDSKFGDALGNFQFTMMIYLMILGVQCGIVLVGNILSALILDKAFTYVPVTVSVMFILVNAGLIILKTDPTGAVFLFVIPGACMTLTALGSVVEARRHPASTCILRRFAPFDTLGVLSLKEDKCDE